MIRLLALALLLTAASAFAATEPRITRLTGDVKLLPPKGASRAAAVNATLVNGTAIQTSGNAQADLRFANGTLVRLGGNSLFAIADGSRRMGLGRGAVLVHVPRGAGETHIATGKVSSSIGGTTALLEHYPEAYIKLISVDGTARIFMREKLGESVLVKPGQLLMFHTRPAPTGLPNPVDIDIRHLVATSKLIRGLPPLGSEQSIAAGVQDQRRQKSRGTLHDTNLVIFGRGTLVSLVPPSAREQKAPKPSPTPDTAQKP